MPETRRKKIPSTLRAVIAKNVLARARVVFKGSSNLTVSIRKHTADSEREQIARSTIQRILSGRTSATLEQLEGLSKALELAPYQLLLPDLDPSNPQLAKGATADERSLYRLIAREAVAEALQQHTPAKKK